MQTQPDRDAVIARLEALFGPNWRAPYAAALGLSRQAVYNMTGPTLRHAAALLELLGTVPFHDWPPRWSALVELHYRTHKGVDA